MSIGRTAAAAALLGAAVAAGGCGDQQKILADDIERKLQSRVGPQVDERPTSADCPGDVAMEKGRRFQCRVYFSGGRSVPVMVELTDDKGHFRETVRGKPTRQTP